MSRPSYLKWLCNITFIAPHDGFVVLLALLLSEIDEIFPFDVCKVEIFVWWMCLRVMS